MIRKLLAIVMIAAAVVSASNAVAYACNKPDCGYQAPCSKPSCDELKMSPCNKPECV